MWRKRPSLNKWRDQKRTNRNDWLFQSQRKSCNLDFAIFNSLTQDISDAITSSKLKYHERLANKLNDPTAAPTTYWNILKTFANVTKIPVIPPLLVGNQLVSDFLVKANLFNDSFIKLCATIDNNSSIPGRCKFCNREKIVYLWNLFRWYCKDYKVIGFQ